MATKKKEEAVYAPPASQVDLEARLANGNRSDRVLSTADSYVPDTSLEGRSFKVEDNDTDAYLNTDPIYQNYANETEKPEFAEDGPESQLEAVVYGEAVQGEEGVISVEDHEKLKEEKAQAAEDESSPELPQPEEGQPVEPNLGPAEPDES